MRLFLSAYRAGKYSDQLVKLFGESNKVAVITNAKDYKSKAERQESVDEVLTFFEELKIKPVELDLRKYFGKQLALNKQLSKYSSVWVAGGNTFVVRRAMKYSGCDKILSTLVRKSEIVYGGESAGAILATPTFTGVEFGDEPDIIPRGYKDEVINQGLGFVPYHIVPHYNSVWEGAKDMIAALKKEKLIYKTLTDDQAILINGKDEEFLK